MIELKILSALFKSREFYTRIKDHIDPKNYSRHFQLLYSLVSSFYTRDLVVGGIDTELLVERLKSELPNQKHLESFQQILDKANAYDVSSANLESVILDAKRHEFGNKLAAALINKDERKLPELLESYQKLHDIKKLSDLESVETPIEDVSEGVNVNELVEEANKPGGLIKLYPKTLNERVGGGVPPETHILLYGRPESGKSAQALTFACGFASQSIRTLLVSNEDPKHSVRMRLVSCITGLTKEEILRNPKEAQRLANQMGLENVILAPLTPGNFHQIENLVKKYEAKSLVIDQLRNVDVKADTRVLQLEAQGTAARNLAKRFGLVVVSVTQAGDSANGKAVLSMGDVDFSNTGLPACADIMVGVGTTQELEGLGERCFSLPKNKISGNHESFYVKIDTRISRVTSYE